MFCVEILVVCHLPTICTDKNWPKEFSEKTIFFEDYQKLRVMALSVPLVIFKFCTTKNLLKNIIQDTKEKKQSSKFSHAENKKCKQKVLKRKGNLLSNFHVFAICPPPLPPLCFWMLVKYIE